MESLSYIDEHDLVIEAERDAVWHALERVVDGTLRSGEGSFFTRALGTHPRAGFAVAESTEPTRLVLQGRHRFSRYELAFDLAEDGPGRTRTRATTRAAFPGPHGRAYKLLVISTRLHVLATRTILRRIERAATQR